METATKVLNYVSGLKFNVANLPCKLADCAVSSLGRAKEKKEPLFPLNRSWDVFLRN